MHNLRISRDETINMENYCRITWILERDGSCRRARVYMANGDCVTIINKMVVDYLFDNFQGASPGEEENSSGPKMNWKCGKST